MSEDLKARFFDLMVPFEGKAKLSGKLVAIDEAICWVAFDQFSFPNFGPRLAHEFLAHADFGMWLDEEAEGINLLFSAAQTQVFNAIENGHIYCVGKEAEREDEQGETVHPPIFTNVTPEMLTAGGWREAGRSYEIGERQFDGVFVNHDDLIRLFSPLKRSYAPVQGSQARANIRDTEADEPSPQARRGRRPKYDWEKILAAVSLEVGQSGEPPQNQAALERMIADQCMDMMGQEPASSLTRQKASSLFELLRQKS